MLKLGLAANDRKLSKAIFFNTLEINQRRATFWGDIFPPPRRWHPTPVFLPGKSHGRRGLVGCSPWGHEESDTTARLHFHFSLLCIGGGNGNPLQCSCLENPRDGGAWWAAVSGVAQSQTRLKWLSSSSSSIPPQNNWISVRNVNFAAF